MAFSSRTLPSHLRQGSTSTNPSAQSTGQSPALLARVNEKRAELENLKELRDLSAAVANQMEALEQKLATLSDGTEAKIPSPRNTDEAEPKTQEDAPPLPQTLVRIPTEHAPALQAQAEGVMENEHNSSSVS
ncbi:DASH complex subunit dad2 [Parahypoxylon ruwenzoriense]